MQVTKKKLPYISKSRKKSILSHTQENLWNILICKDIDKKYLGKCQTTAVLSYNLHLSTQNQLKPKIHKH